VLGMYPLSGVQELRLRRGADVGSSVDMKSEPAALRLTAGAVTRGVAAAAPTASILICGECSGLRV